MKFTAPGTAPPITITEQRTGGQCRFTVTDNGIGIDPEHRERIFVMFKRLHTQDYPGTGIGLALVKKIIEQHDGQVGVADPPPARAPSSGSPCPPHRTRQHDQGYPIPSPAVMGRSDPGCAVRQACSQT